MRFLFSLMLNLWPGFRGVATRGLWDQLAIALIFGVICQGILALNLMWENFPSATYRYIAGGVAFFLWIILSGAASARLKRYEKMRGYDADGEAFSLAQTEYLRGNWFETEQLLKDALKKNPEDADALLFLATLYRRLKRRDEAQKILTALQTLDGSYRWRYEIYLEKESLRADEDGEKDESNERTMLECKREVA